MQSLLKNASSRLAVLLIAASLIAIVLSPNARANVVRLAPNIHWNAAGSRVNSLTAIRGKAVVLLIADSPDTKAFRKQVKKLWSLYHQFSSRDVIFIVAFRSAAHRIEPAIPSNIPFIVAENGASVAANYGVRGDFNLIVIGKDGNVDYQTNRVCAAQRIEDVITNSYAQQAGERQHSSD